MTVVTRFAPSPTGNLHIGGARTALFAWAFARKHSGQLILRLEDTDLARSTPESTRGIIRDLTWLGLDWDQGPNPKSLDGGDPYDRSSQLGDKGPYFQSQRHADGIYDKLVQKLLDEGKAYEEDDAVRFRMDRDIAFDDVVYGHIEVKAADLEDFIIRKGEKGGKLPTFHFAVTVDDALMGVTHVIRGQEHLTNTSKHAALCDALGFDRPQWVHLPSIMNSDGSKMSKRDIVKAARKAAKTIQNNSQHSGEEFVRSFIEQLRAETPKLKADVERLLPDSLLRADAIIEDGLARYLVEVKRSSSKPEKALAQLSQYADAIGADISKLITAEIDDALVGRIYLYLLKFPIPEIEVADFKRSGYLQSVVLNYIALLGWNPGDGTERFDLDFLVEHFDLKRIGKKNSQFDRVKLAKFNAEVLAEMEPAKFKSLLKEHFATYRPDYLEKLGDAGFELFATAYQARSQTLDTPADLGRFFVCSDDEIEYNDKAVKKNLTKNDGEGLNVLKQFREVLAGCEDWTADTLHGLIESFTAEKELKNMGSVAQPLRVAMTGNAVSPEIGPTLELLGKQTVLNRIDRCITTVSQ